MKYTDNLNLKKPEQTEFYNVDDFNENADKLDNAINRLNTRVTPIEKGGTGATTAADACKNLGIVDMIYPVGSLYWSKKPTNPEELFGGKWTQIKDKFILAAGDTYKAGTTGGSADVTLNTEQIPEHGHTASCSTNGEHYHGAPWDNTSEAPDVPFGWYSTTNNHSGIRGIHSDWDNALVKTSTDGTHTHTIAIDNTGGGQPHNNMPPYVTYYCWERTA